MDLNETAILWDMDGTIIDTRMCHYTTWRDTLRKHGYDLDWDVFKMNFGRNTHTILPLFLGFKPDEALAEKLIAEKEQQFRQIVSQQAALVPGVKDWLEKADVLHIPQAIASSGPQANIKFLISSFGLLPFFDAFVSGADLPAKPEPDVFLNAAGILKRQPEQCLVIEDSLAGVEAARNAGMHCIAVATSLPPSELTNADLIVADFTYPFERMLSHFNLN